MHTVVETPGYLRDAEGLFSKAERAAIVEMVAADPECGDLIPGTGGFRKVRVARRGGGKRGDARIVYLLRNESFPVFLIAAYAKNEKANLSEADKRSLKRLLPVLVSRYMKRS